MGVPAKKLDPAGVPKGSGWKPRYAAGGPAQERGDAAHRRPGSPSFNRIVERYSRSRRSLSHHALDAVLDIEKIVGYEIPDSVVKRGGYQSGDEFVGHMPGKLAAFHTKP